MPRSASVVGLAKRGVIPQKQFYNKLFIYNTVMLGVGSTLFRLSKSGQYTELYTMIAARDGQCNCFLTQGRDGIIYGTAVGQGKYGGGTYSRWMRACPNQSHGRKNSAPIMAPRAPVYASGGRTYCPRQSPSNGTPATTVSSSGPHYVWATVPAGATTGPIIVTTPGGISTTPATFTVQ
jgi:hypothetical protein